MALTRREFLTTLAGAEASLLLPRPVPAQSDEEISNVLTGVRLEPFVDALPMARILQPIGQAGGAPHYRLTLSEFHQKLHRDLPPTLVWGFEGSTPGPMIVAERGCPVIIDWLNRLLIDHNIDGAERDVPEVRTTIHLHGGHVSAENDGYPDNWITPGHDQRTFYPNRQRGAMLWYHDHAMGITRLNAMMGLAGLYMVHDPEEDRLGLVSKAYDIPLVMQDRTLDPQGRLVYPVGPMRDAPWVPEFFGSHMLVNGRVSPYLDVEPRLYRFRMLNASNSRTLQLSMLPEQKFFQIGTDGGLLTEPVILPDLLLAPAERADVLVDFRGREGRRIMLVNFAPAPYPSGGSPVPGPVLQFRVRRPLSEAAGRSKIPDTLSPVPRLKESAAVKTRRLKLVEVMPADGGVHRMLLDGRRFMDPVTEDPVNQTVEIWEIVNPTIDAHPIHLHTVHFQLLHRRPFNVRQHQLTSAVVFSGNAIPPRPEELGWKDTIICPPGQVTSIITPFQGEPGTFVWHCHMLEHEDNEMMRPFLLKG